MLEGEPIYPPEPDYSLGIAAWDAQDKWFENYCKANEVFRIPYADGYAYYLLERPDTVRPILIYDEWEANPAFIRGLTIEEAEELVAHFRNKMWWKIA